MKPKRMSCVSSSSMSLSSLSLSPLSVKESAPSIAEGQKITDKNTNSTSVPITTGETFTLLKEINDRLVKIEEHNNKINDTFKINYEHTTNNTEYREKFDTNLDKISTELLKHSKILDKVATTEQLKSSTANICSSIERRTAHSGLDSGTSRKSQQLFRSIVANKTEIDTLELSFSNDFSTLNESNDGRPSISLTQTVDDSIVEMMKQSDKTTWETFDIIRNEMKEQTKILTNHLVELKDCVEHINRESPTGFSPNANDVRSPLIDSIIHDTMEKILSGLTDLKGERNNIGMYTPNTLEISNQPTKIIDLTTGNSATMDKLEKEVFTQNQIENDEKSDAETLKNNKQKRINPNLSGDGPGIGLESNETGSASSEIDLASNEIDLTSSEVSNLSCHGTFNELERDALNSMMRGEIDPSQTPALVYQTCQPLPSQNEVATTKMQEFYLTKFKNDTTRKMIIDYMASRGVCDAQNVKVRALISRNCDPKSLSFISFKIDSADVNIIKIITTPDFWPTNCTLTPFAHKPPTIADLPRTFTSSDFNADFRAMRMANSVS